MGDNLPENEKVNVVNQEENFWLEIFKTVAMAVVLSFGIRTFVAEARYIPSSSMEPTLLINDRLIVEKMSYRFNEPKRGDVVVFNVTDKLREENFQANEAFIKRIIGLPGDEVMVKNGKVIVNNEMLKENYIKEKPDYNFGPVTVPENQYLVLGDNRNNSYDSHYWGFVPREKFIGRASLRFWPPQRVGLIDEKPTYIEMPK
ncbi:MAG: signal peptidase I [Cyanobacteria bacterium]|nr:signal peptidase I [Cyanobacteria bacterium CG_2015-16_32_12]NCO78282.1 signal peptidase I [Cyanobacteria bacterium CG_2015-22_32_23]NCQ02919.1 signal peptidase I [Cyanobacteria bacterium CG_2015-09_32_10]NCQ41194.1 signal peptidase I [Cyanobacteria bacterium CG_2015-04_32_10]NCS83508.1 signal peptidase I [Cyanobacteria bacterium CG_2015-02_32_10]